MSIFNDWATFIASSLRADSELVSAIATHGGEIGSAREEIIRQVLFKILPPQFEIGTGEIIDSGGARSKQIDIVIARKDFPALALPSGAKIFLIESVLATIEVKSTLTKQSLHEALDNCASVARLIPNVVAGTMDRLASERGLKKSSPGSWTHDNPMETARFELLARPPSYIFGFRGYESLSKDFATAIVEWAESQEQLSMRHYPATICTSGCYLWRNAMPYYVQENVCAFVGREAVPLRLLVLHLLYTLGKKMPTIPDINGIVPNLDVYLQQIPPRENIDHKIGQTFNRPQ